MTNTRMSVRTAILTLTLLGAALGGCATQTGPAHAHHRASSEVVEEVEWRFTPLEATANEPASDEAMAKKKAMMAAQAEQDAMAKKKAMLAAQVEQDAMAKKKAMLAAQVEQDAMAKKKAMLASQASQDPMAKKKAMLASQSKQTGGADFLLSTQWARMASLDFHEFKGQDSTHEVGGKVSGKGVTVFDAEGEEVALDSLLRGPTVIVMMRGFYGNVCPYCTTYTAQLATRYDELQAEGIDLLVLYPTRSEDAAEVDTFRSLVADVLEEEGQEAIPFPVYLDRGLKVVERYNLSGDVSRPSTLVLDAEGRIRYLYVGRNTADRPDLDRVLLEARQAKKASQ